MRSNGFARWERSEPANTLPNENKPSYGSTRRKRQPIEGAFALAKFTFFDSNDGVEQGIASWERDGKCVHMHSP